MKLTIKTTAFLLLILMIFSGTVSALEKINITDNVFFANDCPLFEKYSTKASTVGGFLKELGIELQDGDKLSHALDERIASAIMIRLTRAVSVNLIIDGNPVVARTTAETVGEFIEEYSEETGSGYIYDEALGDKPITEGMSLALVSAKRTVRTKTETIPFAVEYVTDGDTDEDYVISEGAAGRRVIKTAYVYEAGKLVSETVIYDNVDFEPIKRVVRVPVTKAVSAGGAATMEYSAKYNMSASAYTLAPCCVGGKPGSPYYGLTASGMKAGVGVVAVDPNVIPLGSELFIAGYGYAIAGDTGGAIKGMKIDLFFNTLDECYQFGRRNLDVYVIKNDV